MELPSGLQPSALASIAPLYNYSFLTPRPYLGSSLSYYGPANRLRRFTYDLITGARPLKVGVVGGSITYGVGAIDFYNYFDWFCDWLKTVTPQNVTCRNGAIPATPTAYMVLCLPYSVDPDVDLVFVEYTQNDGVVDHILGNRITGTTERLLRALLALPNSPAVVMMQGPTMARDCFQNYQSTSEYTGAPNFVYYSVPVVSPHTTIFQLVKRDQLPGFEYNHTVIYIHPGTRGHKLYVDTLVHLLQQTALDLIHRPLGIAEVQEVKSVPLPDPIIPGNLPPSRPSCMVAEQFRELATSAAGWTWVNEGTDKKPKWGFVSNVTGSELVLQVDTVRPTLSPEATVTIFLYYLGSYTLMGTARVDCVAGCTCKPLEIDSQSTRKVSETHLKPLDVSQHPACHIRVTVLDKTTSGGHRFKMAGMVVTEQSSPYITSLAGEDLQAAVTSSGGWAWEDQATPNEPRWGYSSEVPGSALVLETSTLHPAGLKNVTLSVSLEYLSSNAGNMGMALVECVSGCRCAKLEIDGRNANEVKVGSKSVEVSQDPACRVRITVLDRTSSGGHRFKVMGARVVDRNAASNAVIQTWELGQGLFYRNPGVDG